MDLFLQFLVNGLVTGSFYALSALGLTLIFGLMRVVNFAHGEFYMLGGVLGWFVTSRLGLDFISGMVLVALVMAAFGWLVDRLLIERVRDQGEEAGILLTIGLSIFLANSALLAVGTAPLKIEGPVANKLVLLGPVATTQLRLFSVAVCALLILGAHLLVRHTRLGRAMRATFQDPMAARLAGIKTERVYAATFALGSTLAAMSGMLLGSIYSAQVSIGGLISLKAFVVGVAEAMWGGYISTGLVDIIGFIIVILTLIFRPYGLFSTRSERA
jgi:branched-chain amino acid transport system permease protein